MNVRFPDYNLVIDLIVSFSERSVIENYIEIIENHKIRNYEQNNTLLIKKIIPEMSSKKYALGP